MKLPRVVIIRPDMKNTEALLTRIAVALERATGIIPPGEEARPGDSDVMFSTERDLVQQEIEESLHDEETPVEFRDLFRSGR